MKKVFGIFFCVVMVMGFSRCAALFAPEIAMAIATESAKFLFNTYYGKTRSVDTAKTDFANHPKGFGIVLKVEKRTENGWEPADEKKQVFQTDDRVRFVLRTNGSSYIGIIGKGNLIRPLPNGRNLIPDNEFLSTPNKEIVMGPFAFDPSAGKENYVLIISPVPFSEQAINLSLPQPRTGNIDPRLMESMEKQFESPGKSRNMVSEVSDNVTYIASEDSEPLKPIRYEFHLEHR